MITECDDSLCQFKYLDHVHTYSEIHEIAQQKFLEGLWDHICYLPDHRAVLVDGVIVSIAK